MKVTLPELSLVVLIGVSGSGKSTFAKKHFRPTEVISSDFCRGLVSDDENNQTVTKDAFEVLHFIASKRLALGKLTVIDATNVQQEARKPLVELARRFHCIPIAIVFDLPEKLCEERNKGRSDREFGLHVIHQQHRQLQRSLKNLKKEGFRHIFVFNTPEEVEDASVERQPLWTNRKYEHGPFDIIGDIHGCFDELVVLLEKLGYVIKQEKKNINGIYYNVSHAENRKAIFLGDFVDRGPKISEVLRLVMSMIRRGTALCAPGNHEAKLLRKLKGRDVQITHGLADSLEQLNKEPPEFKEEVAIFLDKLISHYVLDDGKLVVAHAGMKEEMQGRGSAKVRDFALFGETTGETDEFGLPVRYNWAKEYRGKAMVVYGHTPVQEPQWFNNTINIDTGCVFGGKLTALRYPEKELVSVPAQRTYYEPVRPLVGTKQAENREQDEILDIDDVLGKRVIATRLHHNVIIREENAIVALEVMSRFAANPKWLIYLPPTMSPSETTKEEGLLEHPQEAFDYYKKQGVQKVICEEKHMGSRALLIVCRNEGVAQKRFGVIGNGIGICYTRTGRHLFEDKNLEDELSQRVNFVLVRSKFWEEFQTDWVLLDCELLPWSAKAQELLREQYAAVGSSAQASLSEAVTLLKQTAELKKESASLLKHYQDKEEMISKYVEAYRQYCWPVKSINDIKLAPFHLLATEKAVYIDKDHLWHMEMLSKLCKEDSKLFLTTKHKVIDLRDSSSIEEGIKWWEELTKHGGEGIVVKPLDFIAQSKRGIVQPAVKSRGKEYLRIIYGPEYTTQENLMRLRNRNLAAKRSMALREFALGIEGLERFVNKEPLYRVHECVFGVLALESEPVDPRL